MEQQLLSTVPAARQSALALVAPAAKEDLLELPAAATQLLALALPPLPTEERLLPLEVAAARRQVLASLLPLALEDQQRPLAPFEQLPILELNFAVAMEDRPRLTEAKSRFLSLALTLNAETREDKPLY